MTILHYIPSIGANSGGVGFYMQLLARDLGKLCDLHILTHKEDDELLLENCTIHYLPYKWLPWNNCKKDFLAVIDEIKPDVFQTNSCWKPVSALTAIWAKKYGCKVIYTPHGMLEPYAIKRFYWTKKLPAILIFQRKGVCVCDLVHATADSEMQNLINLGWNRKVHVIPNCVQIDNIKIKKSWERKRNILFLSRIHPKKGLEFLIEAVSLLKKRLGSYTITIAGSGDKVYVDKLKEMSRQCGIDGMMKFVGPVYGEAKWALYQNADLFVLPTYSENFGIVIPEALASGTPVITTLGTPWTELNELHCGWCVEIGIRPLVEAILSFLKCNEKELENMGRIGRQLVEDKYSSSSVALQFIDMYNKLSSHEDWLP